MLKRALAGLALAVTAAALCVWLGPLDARRLVQPRSALVFEDRHGALLGTIYTRDDEQSVAVPLGAVSPAFVAAAIAVEDARFGSHPGVDPIGLARAALQFVRTGRPLSGGSTIAMQLARIGYDLPRTFAGKADEIDLALRLTAGSSPNGLLEAYCNRVPMGRATWLGVEAASRTYFGEPARDLDLAHATLLAAIPNDPSRLDPYAHMSALRRRQALVLERMVATGAVGREAAERAEREPIALVPRERGIVAAPHLLFALAPAIEPDRARVRTTIDLGLQRFVEAQLRVTVGALSKRHVGDAAALVLDNHTGEILAYAGSPDFFSAKAGRVDGVQALRQPGSALKPFLYELGLERRTIRPVTILRDEPATYALPDARLYQPRDYSGLYAGPVRIRIALANSLNVPAVRVLERVGVATFLERLRAAGFAHLTHDSDYYGLGLTLGSGEVSLFELARAYAEMANQGKIVNLRARLDVPAPIQSPRTIGDAASWSLVTDILADPFARARAFGINSILRTPFPTAVKTGTSSDFRDTWTVGFSRDYTVATWVGNFDGSPMREVSGVTGAGPLWSAIFLRLHERREPARFDPPSGYVRRPICAETGERPSRYCRTIVREWLDRDDLIAYARRPNRAGEANAGLHILSPAEGDRYVYFPGPAGGQRIALRADTDGAARIRWSLNGRPLEGESPEILWALRPGSYLLVARRGQSSARVRFTVGPPLARQGRRGFTVTPPRGA